MPSTESQDRASTKPPNDLKVVIIGGGVCGLLCSVALKKFGMEVHLYEGAAKFGEVGAAIGIGHNTSNVLEELGMLGTLLSKANLPYEARYHTATFYSGEGDHRELYEVKPGTTGGSFGVTRTTFLDSLIDHVDPNLVHLNKRFTTVTQSVSQPGQQVVHFTDGTSTEADVVLLASGIRGAGRDLVTGHDPKQDVAYANVEYYRALAPSGSAKQAGLKTDIMKHVCFFTGKNKHAVLVPVADGHLINISAAVINHSIGVGDANLADDAPRVAQVTREELLKDFEEWGSEVQVVLSSAETLNRWSVELLYPHLETYVKGRIALLGDAAHAMAPHLGAGAGQGIEDAYLLAQLLSDPRTTKANVEDVLKAYDAVRRPRARKVWEATQRAGRIYEGHGESGNDTAEGFRRDFEGLWEYIWHRGVNDDRDASLSLLKEQGVFE